MSASLFPPDRVTIVGVLNLTPDSFSDGGRFVRGCGDRVDVDAVLREAEQWVKRGVHLIDVGGESTRPGADEVPAARELQRTLPAIEALAAWGRAPISIDTRKAEVARAALEAGARAINDVSGLRHDAALAEVAAAGDATLIVGHMRGTPASMRAAARYDDVLLEVEQELGASLETARRAGVREDRLVADPGIGFAKSAAQSLEVLAHCGWLRERLGVPLLVGPSRKSFLGEITGDPVGERRDATLAACAVAAFAGADGLRVHDASAALRAAQVGRALRGARRKELP